MYKCINPIYATQNKRLYTTGALSDAGRRNNLEQRI